VAPQPDPPPFAAASEREVGEGRLPDDKETVDADSDDSQPAPEPSTLAIVALPDGPVSTSDLQLATPVEPEDRPYPEGA
jgi:hypothetical protein